MRFSGWGHVLGDKAKEGNFGLAGEYVRQARGEDGTFTTFIQLLNTHHESMKVSHCMHENLVEFTSLPTLRCESTGRSRSANGSGPCPLHIVHELPRLSFHRHLL